MYEPERCGAQCWRCPLHDMRDGGPVPPEANPRATIAIVGEAPGEHECREGRPFIGPSGNEISQALHNVGILRGQLHITNGLLCRPPDNKLSAVLAKIQKRNRDIKEENRHRLACGDTPLPTIPTPQECCAPRLAQEIQGFRHLIVVGSVASRMLIGPTSILELRGGMLTAYWLDGRLQLLEPGSAPPPGYDEVKIIPTLHPSFVMRSRRWTQVFRSDLSRASRWFNGAIEWQEPTIYYNPPAEFVEAFLDRAEPVWTYDTETDGIEPLTANLRTIQVGTAMEVLICAFLSVDGSTHIYTPEQEARLARAFNKFFSHPKTIKFGWNNIGYDSHLIRRFFGVRDIPNHLDGILLHRLKESELPHNLGFVATFYTDAPQWKCYDGQTEVLTPNGWARFDQLRHGALVAQWDGGKIDFVQPMAYVDQEYAGKAWRLESQAVDLLVTPDHKMVYRTKWNKTPKACPVQDLPAMCQLPHTGVLAVAGERLDVNYVRLLVAMQADGSWWFDQRTGHPGLDFGFTKKRKIERLKQILAALGVSFEEKKTGDVVPRTRIWVRPHEVTEALFAHLGAEKLFGPWLLRMALEDRNAFLAELPLWDGTHGAEHNNYNSSIEANADWVQTCAVTSGYPARKYRHETAHRPMFRVVLPNGAERSRSWSRLDTSHREEVDYSGRIYCVSVPSGFILTRRNGKVTVSGNTDREGKKRAYGSETDEELWLYGGRDVALTARVIEPLWSAVQVRNQAHLVAPDHGMARVCAGMKENGMPVDQQRRLWWERMLTVGGIEKKKDGKEKRYIGMFEYLKNLRELSGLPNLNPGSVTQLRDLLFGRWKLESPLDIEERTTESGDPSTADMVLRSFLTIPKLDPMHKEFILQLRRFRAVQKKLGTYVVKLRYQEQLAEDGFDDEEEKAEREERLQRGDKKFGIVSSVTGRMYPGWNAHVAVTGRLSSSKPINAMNFPSSLKDIIAAPKGRLFVGADANQIDLRVASSRWGCEMYLEAFRRGADPHAMTAYMVFGERFKRASGFCKGHWEGNLFIPDPDGKWSGEAKALRDLAKRVCYASLYMATAETVHKVLTETEVELDDGTTDLPYINLSLKEVRLMHSNWIQNAVGFEAGWQREVEAWRTDGFILDPVAKRRRDFLDGENPNEIVNFPIQAGAAGLMNMAMLELIEQIPFFKWGPGTGVINQCHDAIVLEVPESEAESVAAVLTNCMHRLHPGLPGVEFFGEAAIGRTWKDV